MQWPPNSAKYGREGPETMTNIVSSGTITVTNGSANVTGRGTNFQTALVT